MTMKKIKFKIGDKIPLKDTGKGELEVLEIYAEEVVTLTHAEIRFARLTKDATDRLWKRVREQFPDLVNYEVAMSHKDLEIRVLGPSRERFGK